MCEQRQSKGVEVIMWPACGCLSLCRSNSLKARPLRALLARSARSKLRQHMSNGDHDEHQLSARLCAIRLL